jgi:hypothetical protein
MRLGERVREGRREEGGERREGGIETYSWVGQDVEGLLLLANVIGGRHR